MAECTSLYFVRVANNRNILVILILLMTDRPAYILFLLLLLLQLLIISLHYLLLDVKARDKLGLIIFLCIVTFFFKPHSISLSLPP